MKRIRPRGDKTLNGELRPCQEGDICLGWIGYACRQDLFESLCRGQALRGRVVVVAMAENAVISQVEHTGVALRVGEADERAGGQAVISGVDLQEAGETAAKTATERCFLEL